MNYRPEVISNRILGIDFGSHRIGVSLSDPLGILATPYTTLKNDANLWDRLREIIKKESVSLCVVGMPMTLRGEKAQKAAEVESFIQRLTTESGVKTTTWDERFTTAIAKRTLLEMNTKKKGRDAKSGKLDSMSAAIILQGFLDSKKNSLVC